MTATSKVPRSKRKSPTAPTTLKAGRHPRKKTPVEAGLEHGYRSGLEDSNAEWLRKHGIPVLFEQYTIEFVQPETKRKYTPDFRLPNGVFVETKGRFLVADRQKHLFVKAQRPDLDIRFVFSNPHAPINKGSKTTYAIWCERHGFKWATRLIPPEWWQEPNKE